MKLKHLRITNYKSLKDIIVEPSLFSVFVGPNASGKSNFTDALEFIGAVYRDGLEAAIALKGGYDNIAYRKIRRSKSSIGFEIQVELTTSEAKRYVHRLSRMYRGNRKDITEPNKIVLVHKFSFNTIGREITSDFEVEYESAEIYLISKDYERSERVFVFRENDEYTFESDSESSWILDMLNSRKKVYADLPFADAINKQELLTSHAMLIGPLISDLSGFLSEISIHRIAPEICREPGVPSPNPNVTASGRNLPAVVDWLSRKHPKLWQGVLHSMRDIVPSIEDIKTDYLHTRTLGLFFKEENTGRYWTSHEVSDGTLQTLALLVALADPRKSIIIIEEPENSVHPWILRGLVEKFKKIGPKRSVLMTTHSLVLIDLVEPSDIFVVSRVNGETNIEKLCEIDPEVEEGWRNGDYRISDYLDTGLVPKAIPGGGVL